MTEKLQHQETAYHQLEEAHNKSLGELETCGRQSTDTHHSLKENAATIALLKQELDTKNDLVRVCVWWWVGECFGGMWVCVGRVGHVG